MRNPRRALTRVTMVITVLVIGLLATGCEQEVVDALVPTIESAVQTLADGVISAAFVGLTGNGGGS